MSIACTSRCGCICWLCASNTVPHAGPRLQVKVWSIAENKPAMLASQNLNVGAAFCMSYCRCGGVVGCLVLLVWVPAAACRQPVPQPAVPPSAHRQLLCQAIELASLPPAPPAPCRDAPLILAAGGAKGTVSVWDTLSASPVASYVQQHAPEVAAAASGAAQQQGGDD